MDRISDGEPKRVENQTLALRLQDAKTFSVAQYKLGNADLASFR